MSSRRPSLQFLPTVLLIGTTAVWGVTFTVVRDAVAQYGVISFLAIRFMIAAVALGLVSFRYMRWRTLLVGGAIGLVLALGFLFQTWGLRFTTATNSGLITGLFVVFAPVMDRLLFGVRPPAIHRVSVGIALVGLLFLTAGSARALRFGDSLTVLCAVAFGLHIALLSRHAARHDARALAFAQMLASGVLFSFAAPFFEPLAWPSRGVWIALAITGLFASAAAFWIQTYAQRRLPATRAALILTTEPVFATFFGYLLAGDRLVLSQLIGAAGIVSALVLGDVVPLWRRRTASASSPHRS